jgi:hypothetical protein
MSLWKRLVLMNKNKSNQTLIFYRQMMWRFLEKGLELDPQWQESEVQLKLNHKKVRSFYIRIDITFLCEAD